VASPKLYLLFQSKDAALAAMTDENAFCGVLRCEALVALPVTDGEGFTGRKRGINGQLTARKTIMVEIGRTVSLFTLASSLSFPAQTAQRQPCNRRQFHATAACVPFPRTPTTLLAP